jgi:putative tricarboxylic transport membrane protein
MIVLGVVSWVLNRFGFPPSPIVLGLILGSIAEQGFVQAWTIGSATDELWSMFFGRPISLGIVAFTLLTLLYPILSPLWKERQLAKKLRNENDAD